MFIFQLLELPLLVDVHLIAPRLLVDHLMVELCVLSDLDLWVRVNNAAGVLVLQSLSRAEVELDSALQIVAEIGHTRGFRLLGW